MLTFPWTREPSTILMATLRALTLRVMTLLLMGVLMTARSSPGSPPPLILVAKSSFSPLTLTLSPRWPPVGGRGDKRKEPLANAIIRSSLYSCPQGPCPALKRASPRPARPDDRCIGRLSSFLKDDGKNPAKRGRGLKGFAINFFP